MTARSLRPGLLASCAQGLMLALLAPFMLVCLALEHRPITRL